MIPNVGEEGLHLAQGGDLPCRVWFRLSRGRDDQFICTDVRIESKQAITTTMLRKIPMSEIVERLVARQWDYMDRGGPLDLATGLREYYDGSMSGYTEEELAAGGATAHLSKEEVRSLYLGGRHGVPSVTEPRPQRGGTGPSDPELAQFAAAYKIAIQRDRRHAIAATMRILKDSSPQLRISRATANRWRDECRTRGLLDPK